MRKGLMNVETETAVAERRHKKAARNNVDFSLAVINTQALVCIILLLAAVLLRFAGGAAFDGIRQRCAEEIAGEFNFNEIIENTMAVFTSLQAAQVPRTEAADAVQETEKPAEQVSKPAQIPEGASASAASVTFDEPELSIPQTIYVAGESPLESSFLNLGGEGEKILAEETELDEVIEGASLTEYPVEVQGVLPTCGRISSNFGFRDDPFTGEKKFHGGMDIATPTGTPIAAVYGGYVIKAVESDTGYGNHVVIRHADGLITIYGHCSKLLVETGTVVRAGEIIAEVGSTGNSTGPHLHFEARINGVKVSPAYLVDTSPLKRE